VALTQCQECLSLLRTSEHLALHQAQDLLPFTWTIHAAAQPLSLLRDGLRQDQQLLGQHQPSPQQQLPLAEYHGAGGGMMDGQMGMHGLPMYRQQPPQPPRMRRGGSCASAKPDPCAVFSAYAH